MNVEVKLSDRKKRALMGGSGGKRRRGHGRIFSKPTMHLCEHALKKTRRYRRVC